MSIIKPTVGRVLWYWPTDYDINQGMFAYPGSDQPFAATVAFVHSDRMVNLSVADHNGKVFEKRSARLLQPGDSVRGELAGYAEWMPYQQGQAAKTEKAELAAQALAPLAGCGKCAGECKGHSALSEDRVRLFLNRGSLVTVNGIPLELEHDTVALTHPGNVPLLSRDAVAACKSEVAD